MSASTQQQPAANGQTAKKIPSKAPGKNKTRAAAPKQARITPTPARQAAADIREMWCARLPKPAAEILALIARMSPVRGLSIPTIAQELDRKPTGGSWNSAVAVLRNNELISIEGGIFKLAPELRDG